MPLSPEPIDRARLILATTEARPPSPLAALGAAALAAGAAVLMAGAVILGPGVSVAEPASVAETVG